MPRDDVYDRSGRRERRRLVRVVVDEVPVVVEIRAVDDLAVGALTPRRVDQLEALPLAAAVHVRLEGRDLRGLLQKGVPVDARDRPARNIEICHRPGELLRPAHVLRYVPFRIEDHAELDLRLCLFADRVDVVAHHRFLTGFEQHA